MCRINCLNEENVIQMVRITYYTSHIFFAIDRHDITEILMKVELITITLTPLQLINVQMMVFVTHNYLIYQELA
jgi:hypothetical protein